MFRRARKCIIVLSVILESCSWFDPEYELPDIVYPSYWDSDEKLQEYDNHHKLINYAWWYQFDSAELNLLVNKALDKNNKLQVAIGNILKADADIDKANYAWLPTASIGGGGILSQAFDSNIKSAFYRGGGTQTLGLSFVGVLPSYTVNIAREYQMGKIARQGKKIQQSVKDATRLAIISETVMAYFSLIIAKSQLDLQKEELTELDNLLFYTSIKNKVGAVSQIDVKSVEQRVDKAEMLVKDLQKDIVHFENAISILINENPQEIDIHTKIDDISINEKKLKRLPSSVLKSRPDIAIADYQLQMATSNIGLARSHFFPSIDLTGAFGNVTLALAELASFSARTWLAQAFSVVPIFNMSILADANKAKSETYQAYYNYIQTVREAFKDVDDSLVAYSTAKQNLKKYTDIYRNEKAKNILQAKKQEKGALSKLELAESNIEKIQSSIALNNTKLEKIISLVALYQSLGSGFDVDNNDNYDKDNPIWDK